MHFPAFACPLLRFNVFQRATFFPRLARVTCFPTQQTYKVHSFFFELWLADCHLRLLWLVIKLLMTGPKGNRILNVPRGEAEGSIEDSLFPSRPVVKCFVLPPNSKVGKIV